MVLEAVERRILFATLAEVPVLNSLPSADAKLFLDFNGHDAIPNWLGTDVPATPAYDRDGNANEFNNAELSQIAEIWARVAEKYSPFNINVTTVDPGNENDQETCVIVIGGKSEWTGRNVGGVAPLGGFFNGAPNVGFVFSDGGVNSPKSAAEAAAHEAGHLFDLQHHSLYDDDGEKLEEYDPGDFNIAKIMGVSYYAIRGLWSNSPNTDGPTVMQDDLAILSGSLNGFGYRNDDHGATLLSATEISPTGTAFSNKGIIERSNDVDAFSFTANNGTLSLSVETATFGPMLDATLTVRDAFGTIVGQKDTSSLDETLTISNMTAGTYYITVSGNGNYGDLGQYTLSGNLPGGGIPPSADHYLVQGTDLDDNISVTLVNGEYKLDVNGTITTLDPNTVRQFDILAGDGNDVVTLGPEVCKAYILGGGGNDTLNGGDFADTLTGAAGNDLIFGGGADDRLAGGAGSDILVGGNARDRLYGDAGNDVLKGGASVDRLYGGDGHDVLSGESSADKCYGEDGNDTIYGGTGDDLLNGGDGLDYVYGSDGNDVLYTRDLGFDYSNGGAGTDKAQTEDEDVKDSLEELLA